MTTTDALWGGQLKRVDFEPVAHYLTLEIEVLDRGERTTYHLTCSGVSDLRFTNSIPDPWAYAEVTEVQASESVGGKWKIELVLWSEACELLCTCETFAVTEQP